MHAIPVGLESKDLDFEFIKSKMENKRKSVDRITMNLLNNFDFKLKQMKYDNKKYSNKVKIL